MRIDNLLKRILFVLTLGVMGIIVMNNVFPTTLKVLNAARNSILRRTEKVVDIELTIRMSASKHLVAVMMCDFLRSAVLFWSSDYGKLHFILDERDKNNNYFPNQLQSLGIPLNIRFTYETPPVNVKEMIKAGRRAERFYGYMMQLYSSFLMDLYTDAGVIAWTDTDTIFTQPVLRDSIIRKGKLVVKGMNHIPKYHWVSQWDITNKEALGLPMVSDFMTFFPVYIYPSTIKHCREFIMQRFNVTSFEHAFHLFTVNLTSPVNIIMSYAYYFERELYEWHIDIGDESLENYNENRLPNHPLIPNDLIPEMHVSIHSKYYPSPIPPLHQAICYVQINLGIEVNPSCKVFINRPNRQLFEFCSWPVQAHLETWCKDNKRRSCDNIIQKQYDKIKKLYKQKLITFDTTSVTMIENIAQRYYSVHCPRVSPVIIPLGVLKYPHGITFE